METMMKQLQNNIKQKKESIQAAEQKIQESKQELLKMEQMMAIFNNQQITPPSTTQASTSTQPPPQQELRPQLPKQPTLKQKEEYDRSTNIIETLVKQSTQEEPWYVVFKGKHPGVYSSWAVVSELTNGFPGASYKKFKTKTEAEEAYKTTWSNMVKAQNEKLTQDRTRLSPNYTVLGQLRSSTNTTPKYSLLEFQTAWREVVHYKEEYILRHFYPRKRRIVGPKAIVTPEASPQDTWRLFSLGLTETIYINPKRLSILELFPEKIQTAVNRYREKVSKENEIYLNCKTSYPIYSEDSTILVPSIGIIQMGISNGVYPDKVEIDITQYDLQVHINSILQAYYHSTELGIGKDQNAYIKIDYSGKQHVIYSKCKYKPLGEFELRELARFEENFHKLNGFFNNATPEVLQMICNRLKMETTQHKCRFCEIQIQKEDKEEEHKDEEELIIDNSSSEE